MSYASDRLWDGYVRRNMGIIVSKVKPTQIIPYLPCLTLHDRENIEAKRDFSGHYEAMKLLLDCLRRRENWPEQFIAALEECEHKELASEVRKEYNTLMGVNNPNPSSTPTTLIRAHVHPAPAAAVAPPVVPPPANPEPAPLAPPTHQQAGQAEALSPPEPVPELSQSTLNQVPLPPSTPPPSPEAPREEVHAPQNLSENSESDIHDASGDARLTPEKLPVQDTAPPVHKVPLSTSPLAKTSEPAVTQVANSSPQTKAAAATASAESCDDDDDDENVCLSKPGQLFSVHPESQAIAPVPASSSPAQLFSGNSERLELSESTSDTVSPAPPCHNNSVTQNHNEPEENHYESPNQSFEVVESMMQYAEMPSVPNLNGQPTQSLRPANRERSDESSSEAPGFTSSANYLANEGYNPSAASFSPDLKSQQKSEKNTGTSVYQSNTTKYILGAAGVGACVLLMAWRFRK
ncbi:transcript variant X2 [Nothobranchius furzeri]|uniref:Mitochondrial antiviral-signaling protein n=1 Tax=Nothobranchius furzeri TaxID=105023 RepID=A0A9D2XFJ1_NOTFU|nr:transcript variant X2 [Nothobranchius furzeri]